MNDQKKIINDAFTTINQNLTSVQASPSAISIAMRKPIDRAFRSVSGDDHRKLYKKISLITHPDKLEQTSPDEAIHAFRGHILRLANILQTDNAKNELKSCPQILIETYKDSLPSIKDISTGLASNPFLFTLKNAMMSTLNRSMSEYLRYPLALQYLIYAIQALVNAILFIAGLMLLVLSQDFLLYNLFYPIISLISETFASIFIIYFAIDHSMRHHQHGNLSFFIAGYENIEKVEQEISIEELVKHYRDEASYERDVNFSDEDLPHTVLKYAADLKGFDFDPSYSKLRRDMVKNLHILPYMSLLITAFYNEWQKPLPQLNIGWTSHQPRSSCNLSIIQGVNQSDLKFTFYAYHPNLCGGKELGVIKNINKGEIKIGLDIENFWQSNDDSFNPEQYPGIYHLNNALYMNDLTTNTLKRLAFDAPELNQLPDQFIRSQDSMFYFIEQEVGLTNAESIMFDLFTTNKGLSRINFDGIKPKSQYVFCHNRLFFYDSYHDFCKEIPITCSQELAQQFAANAPIDSLDNEQLKIIQNLTQHQPNTTLNYRLAQLAKATRALIFIPFLALETLNYILKLILSAITVILMYSAFMIKLGVTLLLNMPLYIFDACTLPTEKPPGSAEEFEATPTYFNTSLRLGGG